MILIIADTEAEVAVSCLKRTRFHLVTYHIRETKSKREEEKRKRLARLNIRYWGSLSIIAPALTY